MNSISVTCGIVVKDGKILAAQRSEKMSLPLKWEFPGGNWWKGNRNGLPKARVIRGIEYFDFDKAETNCQRI